jgi:hypothetical protein
MSRLPTQKYPAEFFLEFRSVDRFLYRVSDLYQLNEVVGKDLLERLDNCHIYLLGKRPRLTVIPGSVKVGDAVRLKVEYKLGAVTHRADLEIPRSLFAPEEVTFEPSPYPHRELVTRDANGEVIAYTLLANYAHVMVGVRQEAKDLEIVYVGKGVRHSAQDRLENHSTLQRILAEINSNAPEAEVFALVYSFKYLKNALAIKGGSTEISGVAAGRQREKAMSYRPSLDDQVSLIEASVISYFQPAEYNSQYLHFPDRNQRILKGVYEADFAAIVVQLDNTNIGGLRIYSQRVPPRSTHYIVVDFRSLEGKASLLSLDGTGPLGEDAA